MKLQHLIVIFIIIVLPLTLVLSAYISSQIDTLIMQNKYDTALMDSTYDAINAFEINQTYNDLYNITDTLREDVNASINTFMQSLAINMGIGGYKKEQLNDYVPAILFTLYDGYYIYSSSMIDNKYQFELKPYTYYTVRYIDSNNDVIINYSLDNYIVVYGYIKGDYVVKAGYLVDTSTTKDIKDSEAIYKYVPVKKVASTLNEQNDDIKLTVVDVTNENYNPRYINQKKQEFENKKANGEIDSNAKFTGDDRTEYLYPRNDNFYIDKESARKYYEGDAETGEEGAISFSNWAKDKLDWITPALAYRNGQQISNTYDEFDDHTHIFRFNNSDNDPEDSTSIFAQHKTNVIKTSIQDNLNQAITEFSRGYSTSSYENKLPHLDVNEWEIISNNICMLTFLQGVPMGNKYYNNYALVKSNTNKLFVDPDSLFFTDGNGYYHKIDCDHLSSSENIIGFSGYEYALKRVKEGEEKYEYYYRIPSKNSDEIYQPCYACYYCMIDNKYQPQNWKNDPVKRRAYNTAMAREKYSRYKSTSFLNIKK